MSDPNGRCARDLAPRSIGALLVLLCACAHSAPKASAASAPVTPTAHATPGRIEAAAGEAPEPPDRASHMQATFWKAIDARDALIAGELAHAKQLAAELAGHDYARSFPDDWKHWVAAMQQQADNVALAPDLDTAAQSIGALALSCGNCHYQLRKGPRDLPPEDPKVNDQPPEELRARMYRHQLAADELWLGLIEASEVLWKRGTVTLTRAPLEPPVKEGEAVDPKLAAEVEQIRALAKAGRTARSHPERAKIYGQIIAHCGACHLESVR
jgi:hypothetical protein